MLPIFYYKGIDAFQKLLAYVIKVGNNIENLYFDDTKISSALKNIKDYQSNENKDNEEDEYYNIDYSSLYNFISYTDEKKAKKVEKEPIELRPLILQKNKNFLKYNYFVFFG